MGRRWLWLGVVALALVGADARAATLAPIGSFTDPVFVTSEPNNSDHLLVVEQAGRIELSNGGVVTPYLEIEDLVAVGYEEGLLSVATAPDYASSGLIYVFYTNNAGDLQIDEFRASAGSVSPATRRPVLTIPHPAEDNHNGGQLQFGPDGLLYIGTGDGGGVGDPAGNAQNLDSLLGKILRIDPRASGYRPYTVPASNPLVGIGGRGEIWSWGLRNPWRFSFDRLTGDLTIADVGQNEWEEVNFAPAPASGRGANFGWDPCEGLHAYPPTIPATPCPGGSLTAPVLEYPHTGAACSITGGYVVRDPSVADLYGRYVYADACSAQVSSAQLALPAATGLRTEPFGPAQPSSFGEDACARVYLASLGADAVYRLTGDTAPTCPPPTPGPGDPSPARSRCGGKAVTRVSPDGGRFEGTRRADVIVASPKRDRVAGRGGNDVICGLSGRDVLKGGDGKDFLLGGRGDDSCAGGPRRDRTRSC